MTQCNTVGQTSWTDEFGTFWLNLSGRRAQFGASDSGRVDDGQTNSVCFGTICLAVERGSEPNITPGNQGSEKLKVTIF